MRFDAFVEERSGDWAELEALVDRAGPRIERLPAADLLRLAGLYRAAAADLATARRSFGRDPLVAHLEGLVARARQLVYGSVARRDSVADFCTRGFWWRVRERPVALLAAGLLLVVPTVAFGMWAHGDPARAVRAAQATPFGEGAATPSPDADKGLSVGDSASFSTQIFTNNARVALIAFAGGITGGLLTAAALLFNGMVIGLLAGLNVRGGNGDVFFQLVAPHGLLELSLIVVAGAAGLRVGWALVHPGHRRRGEALTGEARAAAELALGCAAWLVPTGLIEGFVTPRGIGVPAAVAVGLGLAVAFWVLVLWRGRPPTPPVLGQEAVPL